MNTLYIDTHSDGIEFVLFVDGKVKDKVHENSIFHQSSLIMPTLEKFLKANYITVKDIHDIIVINGPGSFTGVRLGVTIAKTLAYVLDIPIRVMSSILIQAVSNVSKGRHWFVEKEKNGYFVGKFNDLDELINDYIYIKNCDFETFRESRSIQEEVDLDYERIFQFSRGLRVINPFAVNPLYVKLIVVQK